MSTSTNPVTFQMPSQNVSVTASFTSSQPLTISFSVSPTSGTVPLTVSINGSWSGGSGIYDWTLDYGNGGSAGGGGSSVSTNYTYYNAGTYTMTLTVTDSAGHSASKSVIIAASAPAPGHVTFYASGIIYGSQWSITANGTTYSSTTGEIDVPCSSGQSISYTVNPATGPYEGQTCSFYPTGQISGTASCGDTVMVTYEMDGCQ